MKFLALKEQLEKWQINEKRSNEKVLREAERIRDENKEQAPVPLFPQSRGKVVSGDIIWRPIDRTAAMLLAKAPWWAKPVDNPSEPEPKEKLVPKPKNQKTKKRMPDPHPNIVGAELEITGVYFGDFFLKPKKIVNGTPYYDPADFGPILLEGLKNHVNHELFPVAKALIDCKQSIAENSKNFRSQCEEMTASAKVFMEDIRQTRMAMLNETQKMIQPLKDIRQFFIGTDYKDQITRLKEFIELCERLQQLKQSGFLDSVAETMLKLA